MTVTTGGTIESIDKLHEDLWMLNITPDKMRRYQPGQFLQFSLDEFSYSQPWPESRTFSIASWGRDYMRILIKKTGRYTSRIFEEAIPGKRVSLKYPYGEFLLFENGKKAILCTGAGISPFLSLLDYLNKAESSEEVFIFHTVPYKSYLVELGDISQYGNVHLVPFVTRENCEFPRRRMLIDDVISTLGDNANQFIFYLCGSDGFLLSMQKELRNNRIEKIKSESWTVFKEV